METVAAFDGAFLLQYNVVEAWDWDKLSLVANPPASAGRGMFLAEEY